MQAQIPIASSLSTNRTRPPCDSLVTNVYGLIAKIYIFTFNNYTPLCQGVLILMLSVTIDP